MADYTNNLQSWDFSTKHVQQNLEGSDFVGSHSVILCATYPRVSDMAKGSENEINPTLDGDAESGTNLADDTTKAYPIGVIDSSAIQQDRNLQQIFEIGSTRSYLMSARTITQMSINRILYNGPTMLRCLYAYYPEDKLKYSSENVTLSYDNYAKNMIQAPILNDSDAESKGSVKALPDIKDAPGYGDFWMNLASDLFSHPMGLVLFVKDNNKRNVAAMYLEECYIQNHSFQMSANSVVMAESCTIRCDRIHPIAVRTSFREDPYEGNG